MSISNTEKAAWCAGFFDGEGHVRFTKKVSDRRHTNYSLVLSNTDPALISQYEQFLSDLGIATWRGAPRQRHHYRPLTTIYVARAADIERFLAIIPIAAPSKVERLREICAWIHRDQHARWTTLRSQIEPLWLAGHSCRCIIRTLGLPEGFHARLGRALKAWGFSVVHHGRGRHRCCL